MPARRSSWWLRLLLTGAVVVPAVGGIALAVYSVHGTDGWANATDAPGFALCGLFGIVPVAVGVVWLAVRALLSQNGEAYETIAVGCGIAAGLLTLSLGEAAAIGLGLQAGKVRPGVLAGIGAVWLYFVAVGLGHWHLARTLPTRPTNDEPG